MLEVLELLELVLLLQGELSLLLLKVTAHCTFERLSRGPACPAAAACNGREHRLLVTLTEAG